MKGAKKSSNAPAPAKRPAQPQTEQPREVPPGAPVSPNHEQIAERARSLWEQQGRPEGRDLEHWLEAERQLRGSDHSAPGDTRPPQAHGEHSAAAGGGELTKEDIESDKSVDGLVQRPREK